ncbi:MAG: sacsin N-terminal ATP-binding-like domain-containing protein [Euzebya sp.]
MHEMSEGQRAWLEAQVAERTTHQSIEQVRTTCSFARAERLLGREYHGRFLIELLQNAADAWREDPRSDSGAGGARVRIVLTEEPALLVANEGAPISAETVIGSLGHIGASTKAEGEAIGHKGIGFKSVLEISHAPEIFSGLQSPSEPLAVAFDPVAAAAAIRDASPQWDAHLAGVDNIDAGDPLAGVPTLRYPTWIEDLPAEVQALSDDRFDTVIRLPLVPQSDGDLATTISDVRDAIAAVSDEILLLLDSFGEIRMEDRAAATTTTIRPEAASTPGDGAHVRVIRDGTVSSSWRVHRDRLDADGGMSSELTFGLRIDADDRVVDLGGDSVSAPFHLFFPTRISSGTPFLLHGYFEVDAARTGFYGGSEPRNRSILTGLATLAADAISDTLAHLPKMAPSLANALAACPAPEDPLARQFRELLLDRLDDVEWIPIQQDGTIAVARPRDVLALPGLGAAVAHVVTGNYVHQRIGRFLPAPDADPALLALIRTRQGQDAPDEFDAVERLLTPGDLDIWDPEHAAEGFRHLLDLIDAMQTLDRDTATAVLDRLRTTEESRLIPTVTSDGIALHPCANPPQPVARGNAAG